MLKRSNFMWVISLLLAFFLISCAGTTEKRRHQSKVTRALGEAYMRERNYTDALKELLKAEKLYADDHLLQNDLGLVYMAKGRFDTAQTHFKKAIQIKPEYAAAKNNLGTVYLATENWDAAIDTFKNVLDDLLYGTPHYPLSNLGLAYYHKGQYGLAQTYYLKALDLEPNFVLALRGLGKTFMAKNDASAAISAFEKAIQQVPTSAELYMDVGDAYQQTRQYEKALFSYDKVVELAPDTPLAEQAEQKAAQVKGRN